MTTRAVPPNTAIGVTPNPALRRRLFLAAVAGGLAVVAGAIALHAVLDTTPRQPILAIAVFTGMMAAAFLLMGDSHPHARFGPANRVTLTRAVLVALAASLAAAPSVASVAWILVSATVVITVLDGLDGWYARRSGMSSVFGARFDMETDAFFMLVLSTLVWQHGKAGIWVLGIGLMRYAFVAAGWMWPALARPLRSTLRGKTMAVVALIALGIALAPIVSTELSSMVCGTALAGLAWSFAIDIHHLASDAGSSTG